MYAASFPSSSDHEDGSSSDDTEVDETLVRELRESLHFCVGKICRAEELAAANKDDGDSDNGMATSISKKTHTVMSKEAIATLTELLAYHNSTSSLANDLCAFSNHANRRTVKADDVLLVARKEKSIFMESITVHLGTGTSSHGRHFLEIVFLQGAIVDTTQERCVVSSVE